ncbi:GNAT family N-acetyltransferase [Photobacterium leiognathi]|uniref:N-acetyltransferase n=1 Tax=Photobacterium leiognathi TaxID=553611 RepID=A0A2T3M8A0_PHOLE|nr:GNAT family N-acetyltransferase [Photobacterium leiognathi]KJF90147.1 acetyltransferase [Photobacterium leiognathi]KJF96851.1 acetyltransferase [Photobacterium leiognathi]PSV84027.1 N-acetyltransferase [Photobacterium leiognathi]PSV88465.1 N-acetyltransferase [Photobacterium leiognathi]
MHKSQPLLTTDRLILRPLQLSDAKKIQQLAGNEDIANGTISVPHPYSDGMAGKWIGKHLAGWLTQRSAIFAITLKSDHQLIGCAGIENIQGNSGQLGYWIGVPYWGNGYCTEAVERIKEFGFKKMQLEHIYGRHAKSCDRPANVMLKIGMQSVDKLSIPSLDNTNDDILLYEIMKSA